MVDLLPALQPLANRCRQDVTWRKVGPQTRLDKKSPLNISVLKRHLRGVEARGVCPILEGQNTTRIAVLDLDSHKGETDWASMTFACASVCKHFENLGYHPVPFRSQGGKGMHIYFIWNTPQDAFSTRAFFKTELGILGFKDGSKGISKGEIEVFPKQDSVPMGGFGNQFILPLAGLSVPLEPMFDYEPQKREYALTIEWTVNKDVPVKARPQAERPKKTVDTSSLSPEIKRMLDAIPNEEANYDLWIKIGMILHTETGASEDGLGLWEEWSQRCPDYSGFEQLQYKWNSFRDDKSSIVAIGSLKKVAAENGWQEDYSLDFTDVPDEPDEPGEPEEIGDTPDDSTPKEKSNRFKPIRADVFANRKPPRWIIKGILPERSTGMTFGGSGDGKTFVLVDMVCRIAMGMEWQGRKVRRGRVVYICAEGAGGFTSRIRAWALQNKKDLKELGDWLTVIPAAPNFLQKKDVEELTAEILAYNKHTDLIVIDTMAQTTTGGDENSAKDMNIALKYLEALRNATKSAAHLVHHAGKNEDRGARGSSTLKAALDVQFQVSRSGEQRLFWVSKMKDGIDGFGWNFSLQPEQLGADTDGEMTSSCFVKYEDKILDDRPAARKKSFTTSEAHILQTWEELGGDTVSATDLIRAAVNSIIQIEGLKDTRLARMDAAFQALVARGEIQVQGDQVVNDLSKTV